MSSNYSRDQLGENSACRESRLEEAELIINLKSSSRIRPHLANPTLTQVNTSIVGTEALRSTLSDSHTDNYMNPMTSLNDTSSNMELESEQAPGTSVSCTVDPILEHNTVSIMGQVSATTSSELMTDNVDSASDAEQSSRSSPEVNPNVIVISVKDANDDGVLQNKVKSCQRRMRSMATVNKPEPMDSDEAELTIERKNVNKSEAKELDDADLTIERKKVHECVVCKAKFTSIVALFRHRVEHNENVPTTFRCEKCNVTFTEPVDLEQHQLMHIENRVFQCTFCQDTFTSLRNFKCHLRIHNTPGPIVCNMCYQVFDKRARFIAHMDDHAWGNSNFRVCHQCSVCKKYFSDQQKLKRHLLRHYSPKQFKCELCPKEFMERHKLTRHMLSHTGRREFTCPHCDRAFSLKHNLATHIKIHINVRQHQCNICKRTFVQKVVLQRHMRIHQDYITDVLEKGIPS